MAYTAKDPCPPEHFMYLISNTNVRGVQQKEEKKKSV